MGYVWDKVKREINLKKHGIDLADAAFVLEDERALSETFIENGELRWRTIGIGAKPGVLLVIHAEEDEDDIAIISARPAKKTHIRQYYQGFTR